MPNTDDRRSPTRRALAFFGLANPTEGTPTDGRRGRSRYGAYVSGRLDEDLDAMVERIAVLEDELRRRSERP